MKGRKQWHYLPNSRGMLIPDVQLFVRKVFIIYHQKFIIFGKRKKNKIY